MMGLVRVVVLLAFLIGMSGCASTSEPLPSYVGAAEQRAVAGSILFYRPNGFFGSGQRPDILIDGIKVGWSSPGTKFEVSAAPGIRLITSPNSLYSGQRSLEVVVRTGEKAYVRTSMQMAAFGGLVTIDEVSAETASVEARALSSLKE